MFYTLIALFVFYVIYGMVSRFTNGGPLNITGIIVPPH